MSAALPASMPMAMQTLVNGASLLSGEQITAPGLGGLAAAICDDVATMIRAVKAADAAQGDAALARLSALKGAARAGSDGHDRRSRKSPG